jgi:cytochrome c oxidase cbb3-type subunit 4
MSFEHAAVVAFAKTFGLFYLIAMCIGVLIYAFWPANLKRFHDAKESVLEEDDEPWR